MGQVLRFSKNPHFARLAILLISATVLYLPVLTLNFMGDDYAVIGPTEFKDVIRCFYTKCNIGENAAGWYRPTGILLYHIEYHLWHYNPFGYHLTNLILYLTCIIAVYFFSLGLLKRQDIAFTGTLLFALHPIHTETVAWFAARQAMVSAIFYILALTLFICYEKNGNKLEFIGSFISFILALCSKEDAITLPFTLLIYVFLSQRNFSITIPYFLSVFFYLLFKIFALGSFGAYGINLPFLQISLTAYIQSFIMLKFKMLYLPHVFLNTLLPWQFVLLVPFMLLWSYYRWHRKLSFVLFFFIISFLPYLTVSTGYRMGGWYMFLPSIPFCLLMAYSFVTLLAKSIPLKSCAAAGIVTLLFFYIYATGTRLNDWVTASELAQDIPAQIKSFITPVRAKNANITVYGLPHDYHEAYVFNNGFERAIQMAFQDNSLHVRYNFLLDYPQEVESENTSSRHYFFACIYGEVFQLSLHPKKKGFFVFSDLSGNHFEISSTTYDKIIKSVFIKYKNVYVEGIGFYSPFLEDINNYVAHELGTAITMQNTKGSRISK